MQCWLLKMWQQQKLQHCHVNNLCTACLTRLHTLQGLAGQMQGVCKGAGAAVLELVLPEEEEEDAQQENTNPNGTGLKPKQEVQHALLFACCKSVRAFRGFWVSHLKLDEF